MFCNMPIFLDNLKIVLPKRRFIKIECVIHKTLTLLWWFMWLYVSNYGHVSTQNQHARKTDNELSKQLLQIDFAWHIELLSIMCHFRPTYFQETQQILCVYIVIKNKYLSTNNSLHCATWCNFRARTWQSKFTIGENNFWRDS